jgi:hypothetical protein
MTDDPSQTDELARLIKIEASKTIKMLEMFMNSSTDLTNEIENNINMQELAYKQKEDVSLEVIISKPTKIKNFQRTLYIFYRSQKVHKEQ